jgi:hypothetical protein
MSSILNSEIIYEVIGDYPVVDKFDVSYAHMRSGSYLDDYVTGSLVTKYFADNKQQLRIGNRGRTFSNVNTSGYPTSDVSLSKTLQPWSEFAKQPYHVLCFDELERYWDSMMPSITETLAADGTNIFEPASDATTQLLFYNNGTHVASGTRGWVFFNWHDSGSDPQTYTNNDWQLAYPFEPKYLRITRQNEQNNSIFKKRIVSFDTAPFVEATISPAKKVFGFMPVFTTYETQTLPNIQRFDIMCDITQGLTGSSNFEELNKVYYGFGDKRSRADLSTRYVGANNFPEFRKSYNNYSLDIAGGAAIIIKFRMNYVLNPIIRGWKYGVLSGLPHFNKAVFRSDSYGQMRDTLEQRQNTKFYITDEKELNIDNLQKGPTQSVVNVRFVDVDGKTTKPENTWSQNLSLEATSSYPYFDGEERNRSTINKATLNTNTINFSSSRLRRITI